MTHEERAKHYPKLQSAYAIWARMLAGAPGEFDAVQAIVSAADDALAHQRAIIAALEAEAARRDNDILTGA